MADLLLVGADAALVERSRLLLADATTAVASARDWPDDLPGRVRTVLDACEAADPSVVLLGTVLSSEDRTVLATEFARARPSTRLLLTVERAEVDAIAGDATYEVVAADADDVEFRTIVEANLRAMRFVRSRLEAPVEQLGRLVVVLSPKGGSGKTMLSTSFAVALQQAGAGSVVLVDLDLQFGDAATAMGLRPEHSMVDVAKTAGTLDATAVKVFLTPHDSGVFLLAAPENPADGDRIAVASTIAVLDVLRRSFDFVVVDTGAGVDEHALAAIERATDLLALCSMDVSSTSNLAKELRILDRLGFVGAKRHLVINRSGARLGLRLEDIEQLMGMRSSATIVTSNAIAAAMNRGEVPVVVEPRSRPSRAIGALAETFVPEERRRRGGRFRR